MIKNKYSFAFTIVELIVVISVIGILAGVTLVSYGSWRTSVATSSVKSDLTHAASAMESSRSFGNGYSATLPTTFTSSSGDTMTLTFTSATSFCIDGTSSNSTIQYYIDNLTQATGPKIGTCAGRTSSLVPGIPTGLTVSLASTTSLSLSWTAASNTTSYTAQCSSDTAFIVGSQITTVTAPTVTAVITGLSPSTSYYCRVNASNSTSTSAWSVTVGPISPATGTPPPPPTNGGVVTTLAGSGVLGSANGTALNAQFGQPTGVAVDSSGNIYVADNYNNLIRKITSGGVVTTLAGSGFPGPANGTGTNAQFNSPNGIAVDSSGNIYVADSSSNMIRKITSGGVVTTLAGSGTFGFVNGTGTNAQFKYPESVAVDSSGNVYVADTNNNMIRKITSGGVVTTLAGSGTGGSLDGTGTSAQFLSPNDVAVDSSGTIYVADLNNNLIRKITSAGVVTTLAGKAGVQGFANGTGTSAIFNLPNGVAIDTSGAIYVADTNNNRIRKIQ